MKEINKDYRYIYSFEPDVQNYKRAVENLSHYNNIDIVPYGLWSRKTELKFTSIQGGDYIGSQIEQPVTNYLLKEWQIPIERIKYPYPVESRLGCKLIGTRIQFFGENYSTCCSTKGGFLNYSDTFEENMKEYERFCNILLSKLRLEEKTDCDGCAQLRYDIWPVKPHLEVIGFDTAFEEDRCNFNCIYCGVKKTYG